MSLMQIKCIYSYNNKVNDHTTWEGYITIDQVDGQLVIEGYEQDKMDSHLERDGRPHLRYISASSSNSKYHQVLEFNIYPGKLPPISYYAVYSKEDEIYYGVWGFVPSDDHPNPINQGEAIICIRDAQTPKEETERILATIQEVANKSKQEYTTGVSFVQNPLLWLRYNNGIKRRLYPHLSNLRIN